MTIVDSSARGAAAWTLLLVCLAGCQPRAAPSSTADLPIADLPIADLPTADLPTADLPRTLNDPGDGSSGHKSVDTATDSMANATKSPEQNGAVDQTPQAGRSSPPGIVRWVRVAELPVELAIMDSVFWGPDDTISLRQRISRDSGMRDARVLEIGTGSGLVALCCLQSGAKSAVATNLNPAAVANARFNAERLTFQSRMDVRLVPRRSPEAWTVISPDERFDLIISNSPWEDSQPKSVEEFALYDPDFRLLTSLLSGARQHLNPGGRIWLAYGCVSAIHEIQRQAAAEHLACRILDGRRLEELPEVFLPGMLIELQVPENEQKQTSTMTVPGGP